MRISDWSSDVCSSDLDNFFFTHVGFSWLDFVDLDHVELVRGPQGTLLGKNTTIGALVVTTKKPSFDPGLELEGTVANRNRYDIRANATGPIAGDTLDYRVTFYKPKGDGWRSDESRLGKEGGRKCRTR